MLGVGAGVCGDNTLTWDNFGQAFMLSWCTGCHNSQLPTAQRAGAPCGINFDSHAGTLPFAASIKVRAVDWQMYEGVTPMPPAAIVPDDELALLRELVAWRDVIDAARFGTQIADIDIELMAAMVAAPGGMPPSVGGTREPPPRMWMNS